MYNRVAVFFFLRGCCNYYSVLHIFFLFACHLKTHTPCDNLTFGITEKTSLDPIAFFFIFSFSFFLSLVVWTVSRLSSKPMRTPLFSLCADFGWAKTVYIFYTRVCLPFRFSLLFAFFLCFPFPFCKSRFFFLWYSLLLFFAVLTPILCAPTCVDYCQPAS